MREEAKYKAALMRELRDRLPGFVCQRIEDRFTSGWPDVEVIGCGRTSYWEVKCADPAWKSHGIQELTMLRLAASSFHARYIFFREKKGIKQTMIVHPNDLENLLPEAWTAGFDQRWLVEHIRKVHQA